MCFRHVWCLDFKGGLFCSSLPDTGLSWQRYDNNVHQVAVSPSGKVLTSDRVNASTSFTFFLLESTKTSHILIVYAVFDFHSLPKTCACIILMLTGATPTGNLLWKVEQKSMTAFACAKVSVKGKRHWYKAVEQTAFVALSDDSAWIIRTNGDLYLQTGNCLHRCSAVGPLDAGLVWVEGAKQHHRSRGL